MKSYRPGAAAGHRGGYTEGVRTCIGCRTRAEVAFLVRVVERGDEVIVDHSATLPGRGAWVHPTVECVELAAKRRAFGRALRVTTALGVEQVRAAVGAPPGDPREKQVDRHMDN